MILKYKNNDVWGYIDNVRQVANKDIDCENLVKRYGLMPQPQDELDNVCYMNGERLSEDICISNKVFTMAMLDIKDEFGDCSHAENFIDGEAMMMPASVVLLYLNDHKEYDTVYLVTNQKTFLMNDKGQTIERLV